jgi:hypothetical protein
MWNFTFGLVHLFLQFLLLVSVISGQIDHSRLSMEEFSCGASI